MKHSSKVTLMATLIASVVGTWAWLSGLAQKSWPAHPFLAVILITVVAEAVVKLLWPVPPEA